MSEVTRQDITELKDDIRDLYDKHNETNKAIAGMAVDVAKIATSLESRPVPKRPCSFHEQIRKEFDYHIDEHAENKRDWKQSIISATVDLVKMGIVAGIGLLIGSKM